MLSWFHHDVKIIPALLCSIPKLIKSLAILLLWQEPSWLLIHVIQHDFFLKKHNPNQPRSVKLQRQRAEATLQECSRPAQCKSCSADSQFMSNARMCEGIWTLPSHSSKPGSSWTDQKPQNSRSNIHCIVFSMCKKNPSPSVVPHHTNNVYCLKLCWVLFLGKKKNPTSRIIEPRHFTQ